MTTEELEEGIGFTEDNDVKKQILEFHGEALTEGHDSMPLLFIAMPVYCVCPPGDTFEAVVIKDPKAGRVFLPLFTSRKGTIQEMRRFEVEVPPEHVQVLDSTLAYLDTLRHAVANNVEGVMINGCMKAVITERLIKVFEIWFPELKARLKAETAVPTREAVASYLKLYAKHVERAE